MPMSEKLVRWPEDGLPFDMRPLRFVLAAAEQTSFSGAALALKIGVSSVSRRVREFEDEIGVSLFERLSSGVRLTDAGTRFLDEIIPALHHVEAALNHARAAGRVEEGRVRIGIITTLGSGFLRNLITTYRKNFAGVLLDIQDGGRRDHLRAIRTREIDIAFFTGNASISDCDVEELWGERIYVAMAADHPLADCIALDWPQLRDERFIVPSQEPGPEVHNYIVRRISDFSTFPDISYRPVTLETLMHMVAIGEGVTLVSEGWTNTAYPHLAYRPLSAPEDIIPLSAVWSPLNDNPALRRFVSCARSLAAVRLRDAVGQCSL